MGEVVRDIQSERIGGPAASKEFVTDDLANADRAAASRPNTILNFSTVQLPVSASANPAYFTPNITQTESGIVSVSFPSLKERARHQIVLEQHTENNLIFVAEFSDNSIKYAGKPANGFVVHTVIPSKVTAGQPEYFARLVPPLNITGESPQRILAIDGISSSGEFLVGRQTTSSGGSEIVRWRRSTAGDYIPEKVAQFNDGTGGESYPTAIGNRGEITGIGGQQRIGFIMEPSSVPIALPLYNDSGTKLVSSSAMLTTSDAGTIISGLADLGPFGSRASFWRSTNGYQHEFATDPGTQSLQARINEPSSLVPSSYRAELGLLTEVKGDPAQTPNVVAGVVNFGATLFSGYSKPVPEQVNGVAYYRDITRPPLVVPNMSADGSTVKGSLFYAANKCFGVTDEQILALNMTSDSRQTEGRKNNLPAFWIGSAGWEFAGPVLADSVVNSLRAQSKDLAAPNISSLKSLKQGGPRVQLSYNSTDGNHISLSIPTENFNYAVVSNVVTRYPLPSR